MLHSLAHSLTQKDSIVAYAYEVVSYKSNCKLHLNTLNRKMCYINSIHDHSICCTCNLTFIHNCTIIKVFVNVLLEEFVLRSLTASPLAKPFFTRGG